MNKQFIEVGLTRFFEIFKDDVYSIHPDDKNNRLQSSYPEYRIINTKTNEIVGGYSAGSYENYHEVIFELVEKEDLVHHYENLLFKKSGELKYKEREIENLKNKLKSGTVAAKTNSQKLLDDSDLILVKVKEGSLIIPPEEKKVRSGPGMMEFLSEDNMIKYDPFNSEYIITPPLKQMEVVETPTSLHTQEKIK